MCLVGDLQKDWNTLWKHNFFFLHKNSTGEYLFHVFMQGILPFSYSFVIFPTVKIEMERTRKLFDVFVCYTKIFTRYFKIRFVGLVVACWGCFFNIIWFVSSIYISAISVNLGKSHLRYYCRWHLSPSFIHSENISWVPSGTFFCSQKKIFLIKKVKMGYFS